MNGLHSSTRYLFKYMGKFLYLALNLVACTFILVSLITICWTIPGSSSDGLTPLGKS